MCIIVEVDNSVRQVSASEGSQPESSDSSSSYLNVDLDDDIDDGEINTTESMHLDEQQVNQELEEVSSGMTMVIPKLLHSQLYVVRLPLKPQNNLTPKRIFVPLSRECIASST
jgi:hypothetical protein